MGKRKVVKKRKRKIKGLVIGIITISLFFMFCVFLVKKYNDIEIKESNYTIKKTESTIQEQTVEKIKEKSKDVSDMIEETTKSVVRNIKIKKYRNININKNN